MERRERSLAVIRYPTEEQISELAYEMFLQHRTARLTDYWRMAETTLLDRAARQIPKVHGPGRVP